MAHPIDTTTTRASDKGLPTLVSELWELVQRYAKQETLDPLKSLGRYLAYGVAGAVLLAIGLVLLGLAALRAIQVETAPHLTGNWSWVPYLAVILGAVVLSAILARSIGAEKRRVDRERAQLRPGRG